MISPEFPTEYLKQKNYWQQNAQLIISNYTNQKTSFLSGCQPNISLQMPTSQIIYILSKRFGDENVRQCLNCEIHFPSPISQTKNTNWLKKPSMVGVNVRTIGSFWNLIKYALTLPNHISSIHLLPIWECGVVASLYGMASWCINSEFFDSDFAVQFPHLNSADKQLKVVVNLLHLMGKTVGYDVVPHTDRYSEITLANPFYFEWLQRKDFDIVDHSNTLINKIADRIVEFISVNGSLSGEYFSRNAIDFFDDSKYNEEVRLRILFGKNNDTHQRNVRRNHLINFLFEKGYEPVPATMAPPYRSLLVDPSDEAKTIDSEGRIWRDYIIEKPQAMSRVFGPLARYKLYESVDNNKNWELDFSKPRKEVFEYVSKKYLEVCLKYNFDFMRGDMSHVQMNPNVLDSQLNEYYDIHKFVKQAIQKVKPNFGYFAESFLVEDNLMAYGNEAKHLNDSNTDTTLGNLQSYALNDLEFYTEFIAYYKLAATNKFTPNFTIFTADKDDPRFDSFYLEGNSCRYFLATFYKYFPSYSSLGFEMRDLHFEPAPNEHYTKLYVFQVPEGPKSTNGPYKLGKNGIIFYEITAINNLADTIFRKSENVEFNQISNVDLFEIERNLIWTLVIDSKKYLFITALSLIAESWKINLKSFQIKKLIFKNNIKTDNSSYMTMNRYSYAVFEIE